MLLGSPLHVTLIDLVQEKLMRTVLHSLEFRGRSAVCIAAMATLIVTGVGFDKTVLAAAMTETGFAVPANVHRGNGGALNAPSGAGMPAE